MKQFNCRTEQAKVVHIISKWELKKEKLAKEIGMPTSTFKNKFSATNGGYRFTEIELLKLGTILDRMVADIQNVLDSWDTSSDDLL